MKPSVPRDDRIFLGASWYPEMWPESEWPKDIAQMGEVGFGLVRVFEFAWKRMEPEEGVYDFDWARRVLDLLHGAGIRAMIGTPSAAPPAWLTDRYPDVLKTDADGSRARHGMRKHAHQHSQTYLAHCRRMVEHMVEALADHPAVHSWQIDNEMSGYDYGEESVSRFHAWLEQRYGDIDALNRTWGLQFWSQAYDEFRQIPLCTASVGSVEVPERNHPSLILAIARFQNQGWFDYIRNQTEVLRSRSSLPICTNMTGLVGSMQWEKHFTEMDRAGVSCYSDLDHLEYNLIRMDRLRSMRPAPYWLLETAPNWSGGGPIWNIHHHEGGIRAFSWLSILLGGSMVLYWQWRSHWAGQEMQHGTCVDACGNWMPGKETWTGIAEEFARHEEWLLHHPAQRGPIAIMMSTENSWVFSIDPIHPDNRYLNRLREDYYLPLLEAQLHRDLIGTDTSLEDYRLILCPHMAILPMETRARLEAWVRGGGTLILGPLTGYRTEEMTAWTDRRLGGLEDLIGASVSCPFSPHFMESRIEVAFTDGTSCHPRIWCDGFTPGEGTEVLAVYRGGYGDGHAAVIHRRLDKGRVVTLGCPLPPERILNIVKTFGRECGVEPLADAPAGVVACPRVDASGAPAGLGLVNTSGETRQVRLQGSYHCRDADQPVDAELTLSPYEVRIFENRSLPNAL